MSLHSLLEGRGGPQRSRRHPDKLCHLATGSKGSSGLGWGCSLTAVTPRCSCLTPMKHLTLPLLPRDHALRPGLEVPLENGVGCADTMHGPLTVQLFRTHTGWGPGRERGRGSGMSVSLLRAGDGRKGCATAHWVFSCCLLYAGPWGPVSWSCQPPGSCPEPQAK